MSCSVRRLCTGIARIITMLLVLPTLIGWVIASGAHLSTSFTLIHLYGAVGAAAGCLTGQALFAILAVATWRQRHGRLPLDCRCLTPMPDSVLLLLLLWSIAYRLGDWHAVVLAMMLYFIVAILLRGISWREMKRGVELFQSQFSSGPGSL